MQLATVTITVQTCVHKLPKAAETKLSISHDLTGHMTIMMYYHG